MGRDQQLMMWVVGPLPFVFYSQTPTSRRRWKMRINGLGFECQLMTNSD